ncbi:MAG TPA: hypothetical protein VHS34_13705 [Terriglobales bacterium]|nr:hypothetical protein [Terriglobales bacterium]
MKNLKIAARLAYFFSVFRGDSSDFFELSDFGEVSDFVELSVVALPSFFDAESPLEELDEEDGEDDFLA